ncbi:oxidoreductase [Paenibacillus filicis]|uniref:Oxidoreductase n=1 Tax=Paenibacillus filicis TaxID=669464 RepID=A0ABU9DMB3_9BACL
MNSSIRVGLIGFGLSAQAFHLPLLTFVPGFEIVTVVSSNKPKVQELLPGVEVVDDAARLFTDPAIDMVVITTPNFTHYALAKAALTSGKHVVVEKPFVTSSAEAMELIELAARQEKVLSVYHNRRWDNDFLTLKDVIGSGSLGHIHTFHSQFDKFRPDVTTRWKDQDQAGSGQLYDLGSHLIDQALQLFGLPETVYGDLQIQKSGGQVDDYFHIVLGYAELRVVLQSGSMVKNSGIRFQLHGDKGSFVKRGLDSQEGLLRAGRGPQDPAWGLDTANQYGELDTAQPDARMRVQTVPGSYERYYELLYEAVTAGRPVPVRADEALQVIQVIELVQQSHREQRVIPVGGCLKSF